MPMKSICVRAIAATPPFAAWPSDAVQRMAAASSLVKHRRGAAIASRGARLEMLHVVADGSVSISLATPSGRTIVFAIGQPASAVYGIACLIDGGAMANDVMADQPTVTVAIPIDAVRAELARTPALWQSIAFDVARRGRHAVDLLATHLFEPLRLRALRVLLALADATGTPDGEGRLVLGLRLPQERLAEMLGVSRQTATALVRELVGDGLVHWRYGRVTLLDPPRLRDMAAAVAPVAELTNLR